MDFSGVRQAIEAYAASASSPKYDDLRHEVQSVLDELVGKGVLTVGPDHQLTSHPLEIRVRLLLTEMWFNVQPGRPMYEDFIVAPPASAEPNRPLVLEVKSSRQPQADRSDLRQLDDWVFDLSGEERARKTGVGVEVGDYISASTGGFWKSPFQHPSPHKGVLIFNGPLGIPFEERQSSAVGANDEEFAKKRDFCIIPLAVLLEYHGKIRAGNLSNVEFWRQVHNTCGILEPPTAA